MQGVTKMKAKHQMRWVVTCAVAVMLGACDLDLTDPNNPNEIDVITDPTGLKQVGIGLQAEYGNALVNPKAYAGTKQFHK